MTLLRVAIISGGILKQLFKQCGSYYMTSYWEALRLLNLYSKMNLHLFILHSKLLCRLLKLYTQKQHNIYNLLDELQVFLENLSKKTSDGRKSCNSLGCFKHKLYRYCALWKFMEGHTFFATILCGTWNSWWRDGHKWLWKMWDGLKLSYF